MKAKPKAARRPPSYADRFDQILTQLSKLRDTMNAKVQQIVNDLAANRTAVRGLTTIASSIKSKLEGDSAVIADLRVQLAAAILAAQNAGLGAAEVQALQDVHDGLAAVTSEVDTDVSGIVADITKNTEVTP